MAELGATHHHTTRKANLSEEALAGKGKGRDIGYALAASSCEEANSVEACTITALDAITAFAVPNPNRSSQSCRFFQVRLPSRSPCQADHPIYFGLVNFYLNQPFSIVDAAKVKRLGDDCQCRFSVQTADRSLLLLTPSIR
jgi:hypothetical protein